MAGPNPNNALAILRRQLSGGGIVDALYSSLTTRETFNLNTAGGVSRPAVDYANCINMCKSTQPDFIVAPIPDFVTWIPDYYMHPDGRFANWTPATNLYAGAVNNPCRKRAVQVVNTTAGSTPREPSRCLLPHDVPYNGMHPNPVLGRSVLVCTDCKNHRYAMFKWRQDQLWLGVCAACRDYVLKAYDPPYDGCICIEREFGRLNHQDANNNGEEIIKHLCHEHDFAYFVNHLFQINRELLWRCSNERKKRKTGGYGWTRRKGKRVGAHGLLNSSMTPLQRRLNTTPLARPDAVPRCYCGTKIHAAGHVRNPALIGAAPPYSMRVRCCVGCNGFRR
jgi:hypothetical protein